MAARSSPPRRNECTLKNKSSLWNPVQRAGMRAKRCRPAQHPRQEREHHGVHNKLTWRSKIAGVCLLRNNLQPSVAPWPNWAQLDGMLASLQLPCIEKTPDYPLLQTQSRSTTRRPLSIGTELRTHEIPQTCATDCSLRNSHSRHASGEAMRVRLKSCHRVCSRRSSGLLNIVSHNIHTARSCNDDRPPGLQMSSMKAEPVLQRCAASGRVLVKKRRRSAAEMTPSRKPQVTAVPEPPASLGLAGLAPPPAPPPCLR